MISGSTADYTAVESDFLIYKPPQSKSEGVGGASDALPSRISQSFSGLLNRL